MIDDENDSDDDDDDTKAENFKATTSILQTFGYVIHFIKDVSFAVLIIYLSIPVVRNLLALDGHQHMNTSLDTFKIVNT